MILLNIVLGVQVLLYFILGTALYFPDEDPTTTTRRPEQTTTPTTTTTEAPLTICTTTGCGVCESITSSGGVISSPNYPADYGGPRACLYIIQVPVGRAIQLTFTVFTLENVYDWINIYSGNNPVFSNSYTLGTSLSGYTSIPSPRTSTSNIMTVQFKSDSNNAILPFGIGRWQAIYTVV